MKRNWYFFSLRAASVLFLSFAFVFSGCDDDDDVEIVEPTGALAVTDQFPAEIGDKVVVNKVTISDKGWVAVYRDNGSNAPLLTARVSEPKFLQGGTATNLELQLTENITAGEKLWVVLHKDDGSLGYFDFNGTNQLDRPITDAANKVVAQSLLTNYTFGNDSATYILTEASESGISGTATFYKASRGDGAYVVLELDKIPSNANHPAHIHANDVETGGGIVVDLNNVKGEEEQSITFVDQKKDGTPITYQQLLTYDGHINVHLSPDNLQTYIAQGNIGANAPTLTDQATEFALNEEDISGASGTATFRKLSDGSTLVELEMDQAPADGRFPAHIHLNSAAEGGGIAIDLSPVDANTRISRTIVTNFNNNVNNGDKVLFEDFENFDGYINVHRSSEDLNTIVVQGDIGGNVLTGQSETFNLTEVDGSGINGTITFRERKNGFTLAEVDLEGLVAEEDYPIGLYSNDVINGGDQFVTLNNVMGASGISETTIRQNDLEEALTYTDLSTLNAHARVLASPIDNTIVAQGNIGSNAE